MGKCGGIRNSFGGDVDLDLLLHSSKYQDDWVVGVGDLVGGSFALMEERECEPQLLLGGEGGL